MSDQGHLMRTRAQKRCLTALLPALLFFVVRGALAQTQLPAEEGSWRRTFLKDAAVVVTPESIDSILLGRPTLAWNPGVYRFRGGSEVFSAVAPAVVVVRSRVGHGTGFLISNDGWIITNNHVIASGLAHDPRRNASYADVYLGQLGQDGLMKLEPRPVSAWVYKADRTRDLALLKLANAPAGLSTLPYLKLAQAPPRPGNECIMIGHPSSGMLWTYRTGQVSAVGQSPGDLVNFVMAKLAVAPNDRAALAEAVKKLPNRRIVLSSCQANPGDSGGPLVDPSGAVIAVTFACPGDETEDKFTYHIHWQELKAFLEGVAPAPILVLPDAWDSGPRSKLEDIDRDGRPDALLLGSETPEAVLLDLENRTPVSAWKGGQAVLQALVANRTWQFSVALRIAGGEEEAFYDSNGDSVIDLILVGDEDKAVARLSRNNQGGWVALAANGEAIVSERYLASPQLAKKFRFVVSQLLEK